MLTVGQQKIDVFFLTLLAVIAASVAAIGLAVDALLPWGFVALAVVMLGLFWAVKWDVTIWAWLWVFSYGLLGSGFWNLQITGFFNMNIPRFVFLTSIVVFALHFMLRKWRLHYDRAILWVMLAMTVYCALSATAAGWQAATYEVRSAPYFRFLGSILFPFLMFLLVYNSIHSEAHIRWALWLAVIYGFYALYIGYLQYIAITGTSAVRALIWPGYINDPDFGIHFDRARGAFDGAGPQALFLVLLFYVDLYLIRKNRGLLKAMLVVQAVLVPPAIFFTGIRSAYVAFLLCGIVWCLWGARERFGRMKLAVAAVIALIGVLNFWPNLSQTDRSTGGVAQRGPIISRYILAKQTWDIFQDKPMLGVGFGHFVDAQQRIPRDPGSLVAMTTGVVVEHNLFLSMAVETGVIGLAAIIAVFVLIYRQSLQLYRKLPPTASGYLCRPFVVLFWVALVNYLTDAMFRDTLWDVFANGLFWSLAALVAGYNRLLDPHPLDLPVTADFQR